MIKYQQIYLLKLGSQMFVNVFDDAPNLFIGNTCYLCQVIYKYIYIYLYIYSTKRRMRYDPENIITHGCILYV